MKNTLYILLILSFVGCASAQIDSGIKKYQTIANKINIGDSKESVLKELEKSESTIKRRFKRDPDQFLKNGSKYFIYFARSSRIADGLSTDNEFTPYIFKDNILIAIGWSYLGGPKTQSQKASIQDDSGYKYTLTPGKGFSYHYEY